MLISELCEKNFFSGFFKALAIQVNQRINFVQEVIWYVKFKKFNIEAYKPGKSSVRKLRNVIKLSANESALGVSSRVKKIISNKNLNFYTVLVKNF